MAGNNRKMWRHVLSCTYTQYTDNSRFSYLRFHGTEVLFEQNSILWPSTRQQNKIRKIQRPQYNNKMDAYEFYLQIIVALLWQVTVLYNDQD